MTADWMIHPAACWGFPPWTQADEDAERERDALDADEVSPVE